MEKLFITIVTLAFLGGIFYVLRTVYNVVCKVFGKDNVANVGLAATGVVLNNLNAKSNNFGNDELDTTYYDPYGHEDYYYRS